MAESLTQFDRSAVQRHFLKVASTFDSAALLHRRAAEELIDRLQYVRLSPTAVLDLGCGTGCCIALLAECFPESRLVGADLSLAMLQQDTTAQTRVSRVVGDAESLPMAGQAVDLVVSNLLLPWCEPDYVFEEVHRVLRPGGAFAFSSFGPDTLKELRRAWSMVDDAPHVHTFRDMHNLGDALVVAGFAEPVMDVEVLTMTYDTLDGLFRDLKAFGGSNALLARRRTLTGRHRTEQLRVVYESFRTADGRLPSTWEIVYGIAWLPERPVSNGPIGVGVAVEITG